MTVRKLYDGQWVADFSPVNRSEGKQGKRVRKKFATKSEALALENYVLKKWMTRLGLDQVKTNTTFRI